MKAGSLDRKLTIRRATVTDNGLEEVSTWGDAFAVWGSKQDVSDRERTLAASTGASITTRFQVRWSSQTSTITAEDQVVCEGRKYAITGIKEIGRREGLEITATAQADAP